MIWVQIPSNPALLAPTGYTTSAQLQGYVEWPGEIPSHPFDDIGVFMWDPALLSTAPIGGPRAWTASEILAEARRRKLTDLSAEWSAHYAEEFDDPAIVALGNAGQLSPESQAEYVARIGALAASLRAAQDRVTESSLSGLDSIHVVWPLEE